MHIRPIAFAALASIVDLLGCSGGGGSTQPAGPGTGGAASAVVQSGGAPSAPGGGGAPASSPSSAPVSSGSTPAVISAGGAPSGAGGASAVGGASVVGGASSGAAGAGGAASTDSILGIAPLAPSQGFILQSSGADIPAGQEAEYCEIARLPGSPQDTIWANAFELGNAKGSHHLIVSVATPGSVGESKVAKMAVGDRIPCVGAQVSFGEDGIVTVGGIQTPYDRFTFPDGVGRKFYGGQYVIFDYHYMNTTPDAVHAKSAIAFHTTAAANVKHEAVGLAVLNYTIDTPPSSTKAFTAECHLKKDVMIGGIARHTHSLGTDYDVWFSGGANDGQHIWTSTDWEEQTQYTFPAPVLMKAGEGFRFRCAYDNKTNRELRFGVSAKDEMCILFASMWEAHDGEGLEQTTCSIVWVDDQGVGHPADEAGGIPASAPLSAATCSLATAGSASLNQDCKSCMCNTCGTPSLNCAFDADCGPILTCFSGCQKGEDCAAKCQPVLEQHSSGVGLTLQAQSCLKDRCPTCPMTTQ